MTIAKNWWWRDYIHGSPIHCVYILAHAWIKKHFNSNNWYPMEIKISAKKHRKTMSVLIWLVVGLPLWKIWQSIGMIWTSIGMIIPNIWENKKWQPNHQPVINGDNPWPLHEFLSSRQDEWGGFHGHGGTPSSLVGFCSGKCHRLKWMMTGGYPYDLGNPHITTGVTFSLHGSNDNWQKTVI